MLMPARTHEAGQTMAEYAVMLTVITGAIVLTLGALAENINTLIGGIADLIASIV
jgi:Flp pilus assembly pilin Flp